MIGSVKDESDEMMMDKDRCFVNWTDRKKKYAEIRNKLHLEGKFIVKRVWVILR